MLYSIEQERYIDRVPHESLYKAWIKEMTEVEKRFIFEKLNSMIDSDEIHTSSWMPGNDWTGTVFLPIYAKACHQDESAAAMCFGLIVWDVLMRREDVWGFGRYFEGKNTVGGMTYFRLHNPPPRGDK